MRHTIVKLIHVFLTVTFIQVKYSSQSDYFKFFCYEQEFVQVQCHHIHNPQHIPLYSTIFVVIFVLYLRAKYNLPNNIGSLPIAMMRKDYK